MPQMDDRMRMIGSAITSQAQQEADDIIRKANEIRDTEIKAFEDEIVTGMFAKLQKKATNLRLDSVKTVARAQMDEHSRLLLHRKELTERVFENVRQRLIEFARSPEYPGWLEERAGAVPTELDHSASVLYVCPRDLPLGEKLLARFPGAALAEDKSIRLGGFRLRNGKARVLADETLDERLENERPWFLENCGLKIG